MSFVKILFTLDTSRLDDLSSRETVEQLLVSSFSLCKPMNGKF